MDSRVSMHQIDGWASDDILGDRVCWVTRGGFGRTTIAKRTSKGIIVRHFDVGGNELSVAADALRAPKRP